jgi:hypothetical protein
LKLSDPIHAASFGLVIHLRAPMDIILTFGLEIYWCAVDIIVAGLVFMAVYIIGNLMSRIHGKFFVFIMEKK